jgi:5-methylcytosine-specific restriction endonuclease McrA
MLKDDPHTNHLTVETHVQNVIKGMRFDLVQLRTRIVEVPAANRRSHWMSQAKQRGRHTRAEWDALCLEFGFRCLRCGWRAGGYLGNYELDKDHIVPISLGGSDGIWNLQPLCPSCNRSKGEECKNWVIYRRLYGFDRR